MPEECRVLAPRKFDVGEPKKQPDQGDEVANIMNRTASRAGQPEPNLDKITDLHRLLASI